MSVSSTFWEFLYVEEAGVQEFMLDA